MTFKRIAILVLFAAVLPFAQADELILHEGKIVKGRILDETGSEVMIRLANNMFLRVDKSKIREIRRDDKGPVRRTVTMETMKVSSGTAKPAAVGTSKPAEVKPAAPEKPVLSQIGPKNLKPETTVTRKEKGEGAGIETLRVQTYVVSGKTFEEAQNNILSRDYGKGPLKEGRRMASATTLDFSWDGKTRIDAGKTKWTGLIVISTLTMTMPEWKAPSAVDDASVRDWNVFIDALQEHDKGHADIYRSELRLLNETLSNIDAANEEALRAKSKTIVMEWRARVEKRQDGHDRRAKEAANKPVTAKPK